MRIAITGGRVFDPANAVDGEVRSVFVDGGTIADPPPAGFVPERTIDAAGRVVFPGGVDMHCHIAGVSVSRARRLAHATGVREPGRDGREVEFPLLPSTRSTGLRYSALGYTTAIDAAIAPAASRQCHLELEDTPNLERGFLLLLANHELLLECLRRGERELAGDVAAWLLRRTGAFGIKAVNPGGVAHWKRAGEGIRSFSEPIGGSGVSPRDVLQFLAGVSERLSLPHPVHIHANRLGVAGNIDVTLETSLALEGRRHHLTHVQFHAYGKDAAGRITSAAPRLAAHIESHPELSLDVGQVMFGDALTLSADEEVEHHLWKLTGKPWVNADTELETGCGMVPLRYKERSFLHSLQWAIGLEIFLLCRDPWRLALTTDHPNGGSFLAYPKLIAHLMDRDLREEAMARADPRALSRTVLRDLSREYTLGEIAVITRAGPARSLGLSDRGHLGAGARADITIYDDTEDREAMFRWPLWVIHGGEVVVENGELRRTVPGATLRAETPDAPPGERAFRDWFASHGSYDARQLGLEDDDLARLRPVGHRKAPVQEAPGPR